MSCSGAKQQGLSRGAVGIVGLLLLVGGVCPAGFSEQRGSSRAGHRPYNDEMVDRLAQATQPEQFSFAVLGDVHGNYAVMGQVLEQMARHGPHLCIQIGDLFGGIGRNESFESYLTSLRTGGVPCFTVMGNHDVHDGARERFRRYIGQEDLYFDYGPARFILLDTSRRWLSTKQLKWFSRCLDTPKRKFVFTHMPPYLGNWWMNAFHGGSAEFLRLCAANSVEHVFVGHLHVLDWTTYEGVPFTCVGVGGIKPSFAPLGVPFRGFVLVQVTAKGSEVKAVRYSKNGQKRRYLRPLHSYELSRAVAGKLESSRLPSWVRSGSGQFTVMGHDVLVGVGQQRADKELSRERRSQGAVRRARAALQDEIERHVTELMRDVTYAAAKYTDPDGNETMEYVHTVSKAVAYACLDEARVQHTWSDPKDATTYAGVSCPLEIIWKQTKASARRLALAPRTPDMALRPGKVFGKDAEAAMRVLASVVAERRSRASAGVN